MARVASQQEDPAAGHTGSSAERSLRLLSALTAAGRALSLAELASALELPKATAHRLCSQLLASGYLTREVDERLFIAGPALRQLALDTLNHDTVRGLRHVVLSDLVQQIGETCNLTTLDGASVLYLDRVEAPWPWRLTLGVGVHVPLHCTASGKLFLAFMPEAQREALLAELPLQRLTANTLTTRKALRAECVQIAERGWSADREEFILGLIAVAVPVFDADGAVRAAIAVHAPGARMSLDSAKAKLPALQAAAAKISRLL
jgi:DNA-binding IclR family transcriptional regulator